MGACYFYFDLENLVLWAGILYYTDLPVLVAEPFSLSIAVDNMVSA